MPPAPEGGLGGRETTRSSGNSLREVTAELGAPQVALGVAGKGVVQVAQAAGRG